MLWQQRAAVNHQVNQRAKASEFTPNQICVSWKSCGHTHTHSHLRLSRVNEQANTDIFIPLKCLLNGHLHSGFPTTQESWDKIQIRLWTELDCVFSGSFQIACHCNFSALDFGRQEWSGWRAGLGWSQIKHKLLPGRQPCDLHHQVELGQECEIQ